MSLLPRLAPQSIGIIGHLVAGFPDERAALEMVGIMVASGVALIEIQIPFSEPMADGPVLMRANHHALKNGYTVDRTLGFAEKLTKKFEIPFVFMTYFNPIFQMGVGRFARRIRNSGVRGLIIPDMPLDCDEGFGSAAQAAGLSVIPVVPPNIAPERLKLLMATGSGFVYAVARAGVTGGKTAFGKTQQDFAHRLRRASGGLAVAMGFGLRGRDDLRLLSGYADYGVIGSHALRVWVEEGRGAYRKLWRSLASG